MLSARVTRLFRVMLLCVFAEHFEKYSIDNPGVYTLHMGCIIKQKDVAIREFFHNIYARKQAVSYY